MGSRTLKAAKLTMVHCHSTRLGPAARPLGETTHMTSSTDAQPDGGFIELGVSETIADALAGAGITSPFPIQHLAIPIALGGSDLIGQARTGTGKTFAYGLPLLQHILEADQPEPDSRAAGKPRALVMAPTRELAIQVAKDLTLAAGTSGIRVITIYGGVGYDEQLNGLRAGVEVVVGTPGRLLDLVQRRDLHLGHVRTVVLDEADEMLNLGFLPDVERLLAKVPASRQTLLFSATMPSQIMALARSHQNHPVHIRAEGNDAQATVPDTTQFVYQAHDLDKPEIIGRLANSGQTEKMMIFTQTKRAAQRLCDELADRGFAVGTIHGDLNQAHRERTLKRFRNGKITILVATDVAARGIDVAGVSHVVNYEVPEDPEQYIHRIGRTGRAGNSGVAVTLVDWQDVTRWKVINKALDLPFGDLVETYSTSPHLLSDLGIPEGTRGFVRRAQPKEEGRGRERRRRNERSKDGETPGRTRRRRIRRRNGEVIERGVDPAPEPTSED